MEEHITDDARLQLPRRHINPQSLELMSDEEFWDYARERANAISSVSPGEEIRSPQYLECKLNCGTFLIPLQAVCEVLDAPRHFALLPDIPRWMLGIMMWRGQAIAVLDLNAYLCETTTGQVGIDPARGMLLVANDPQLPDVSVGLLVHLSGGIENQVYKSDLPIINMSMLLADVVRQIGTAAHHG
ncbi:MAG TPA: chemotaxis protein CheW [Ktedonobacteraceae bacterium]|nr:chemotaxis protein CheW [Ktedonobacteraceae bacterium]